MTLRWILYIGLIVVALVMIVALIVALIRGLPRQRVAFPGPLSAATAIGIGFATNFFDTLGIGSFAPTTAWVKFRKMVPDSFIPGTLNAGHSLPTIAEALIFIVLVEIDPWLLVSTSAPRWRARSSARPSSCALRSG
jgi:hypothetical protein